MISVKALALCVTGAVALTACSHTDWRNSLSGADKAQMNSAVQAALEFKPTGESDNWANAASTHRGTVTPTRTWRSDDGRDCRDYQQTVTVGEVTRVGYGSACRAGNGVWVDLRSPRFTIAGARPYRYRPHRLYYGFGFGHGFGHRHFRFGHRYGFGAYPYHAFGFGYPYYWY